MTTTHETLSRYKFYREGNSNVVEEITHYQRVPQGDPRIFKLGQMRHKLKIGHSESFEGVRYDLYALFSDTTYINGNPEFWGYRLVQRAGYSIQPFIPHYSIGMYFVRSEKER